MATDGISRERGFNSRSVQSLVEEHDQDTADLRARMQKDYEHLYMLQEFDAGKDYATYTSNEPRTYADKIIGWIIGASLTIQMPDAEKKRESRIRLSAKEKLCLGFLRAADDRMLNLLLPSIRDQLAFYVAVRGMWAGRALLVKTDEQKTEVNITPWDPIHTYWGMGKGGLEWACYRFKRSRLEIESEYGDSLAEEVLERMDDVGSYDVYDFYDRHNNLVVVRDEYAKKPTPHGQKQVPVFLGIVGAAPPVQNYKASDSKQIGELGQSVFAANRGIYDKVNSVLATMLELVERSKRPPVAFTSRDGSKTLEEDPYKHGTELALAEGEKVETLDLLRMAADTGPFLSVMAGELQRGAIPYTSYGGIPFPLSGYAINTLGQSIETVLLPRLKAVERAYLRALSLLTDQYETGKYPAMQVSGRTQNREWFDEEIGPDVVKGLGLPEVRLVGNLPQDEMQKMNMAQMGRDGPVPLLPDRYLRGDVLGIQDPDAIEDMIKEQIAERSSPLAALWTLFQSALERGRKDLLIIYGQELQQASQEQDLQNMQLQLQMQQIQMGLGGARPPMNGNSNGNGSIPAQSLPGIPPEVLPPAMQGIPPPAPMPPQPIPPGISRPNRSIDERLAGIGLVRG